MTPREARAEATLAVFIFVGGFALVAAVCAIARGGF